MKRIALIVGVGLASLATLPYSIPVLAGVAVIVKFRRKRATVTRSVLYQQELDSLEKRLREEVRETEVLAKIKFARWKLDKEVEKKYYVEHGVMFPRTAWQDEQDSFFSELERRLADEQQKFQEEVRKVEYHEQQKIEDQRREADAEKSAQLTQRKQEIELARINAERDAAEKIAAALRADLA